MNTLTIVGRVVKEPITKKGSVGSCCYVTVAVNAANNETDYFNVKLFDKQAENTKRYVHKGDLVSVRGSVHLNRWGDNNQYATLSIDQARLEFYGKRANPSGRSHANGEDDSTEYEAENAPTEGAGPGFEVVDDEDMPFF